MPWKPHKYQKKAVKFLLEHAHAGLFLDPGLGKTSITLAAISMLKKAKQLDKVLLIAPLRACHSVWPAEIKKWADFNHLTCVVLHGPKKDQLLKEEADIYVINPEGLEWLTQAKKIKTIKNKTKVEIDPRRWKALGFDLLVIDELSKFKNHSATRFKIMKLILHTFFRRWGLTGSPAANGLIDLFGQCYMLDRGAALGEYITHYRSRFFFNPDQRGFVWLPTKTGEQEIHQRLSPLVLRMSAEDHLDLPELIENNIRVELPAKIYKMYDQLEEDLITKIKGKKIIASTAAISSMKCRQVASGAIYLDPEIEIGTGLKKTNREWTNLHDEKLDALVDLIDELQGSPILVAYDFRHTLERVQERLGKNVPYIGGGVSVKRSSELEKQWNRGELPYLFGHPASIGHALNLQEAGNHVCWLDPTWDYELYDQFIRRVRRQGNKNQKIFVHHIIAHGTIDEVVIDALKSKERGQNALFDGLKKLSSKRK